MHSYEIRCERADGRPSLFLLTNFLSDRQAQNTARAMLSAELPRAAISQEDRMVADLVWTPRPIVKRLF